MCDEIEIQVVCRMRAWPVYRGGDVGGLGRYSSWWGDEAYGEVLSDCG